MASDHRMVVVNLKIKFKANRRSIGATTYVAYNVTQLAANDIKERYDLDLKNRFQLLQPEECNYSVNTLLLLLLLLLRPTAYSLRMCLERPVCDSSVAALYVVIVVLPIHRHYRGCLLSEFSHSLIFLYYEIGDANHATQSRPVL